jgi:hypothetical protein
MEKQESSKEYASRMLHRSRDAKEHTALVREQRIRLLSFILQCPRRIETACIKR